MDQKDFTFNRLLNDGIMIDEKLRDYLRINWTYYNEFRLLESE